MSRTERTVYGARHMADFSAVRPGPLALVNREHPLPGGFTVTLAPPVEAAPDILLEAQAARMLAACLAAIGAGGRSFHAPPFFVAYCRTERRQGRAGGGDMFAATNQNVLQ